MRGSFVGGRATTVMTWRVALRLGRISNLPTVWTNVLTGVVLAGGSAGDPRLWPLLLALSMFYLAGMFLNDAFDAGIDMVERPQRPIPAGEVSRRTVFGAGFAMLAGGLLLLWGVSYVGPVGDHGFAALGGVVLAAAILLYDWHHKANPFSPVLMGICRMLVYLTAALAFVAPPPGPVWLAALILLAYLIGLTYVAKQETLDKVETLWPLAFLAVPVVYALGQVTASLTSALLGFGLVAWIAGALWFLNRREPGDVPRAVVSLIAGIALLDAVFLAAAGAPGLAWLAVLGFAITLALQRVVSGT